MANKGIYLVVRPLIPMYAEESVIYSNMLCQGSYSYIIINGHELNSLAYYYEGHKRIEKGVHNRGIFFFYSILSVSLIIRRYWLFFFYQ